MRLVLVELRRFRARRAIAVILLVGFVLTAVITATTLWDHRPVTAADHARAEARAEREGNRPGLQQDLADCKRSPQAFLGPGADAADCAEMMMPQPEWFLERPPLELQFVGEDAGTAVLVLLTAAGLLVGATFVGADWASGSVGNQLLFQPRRSRIWAAKAAAVVVGLAVVTEVAVALFWGALWYFHGRWGAPAVPDGFWSDTVWTQARGIGLVAAAGIGGYALTMLFRHTGGALGLLLGYAVVGEMVMRSLGLATIQKWLLSHNVFAWLYDGYPVLIQPDGCQDIYECGVEHRITMTDASIYLAVLLVAAVVVSWLSFRRRDIS